MRNLAIVALLPMLAGLVLAEAPVEAGVVSWPCDDLPAMELFLQWDSQLENLAFDDAGHLVVSDLHGDRLLVLDSAGNIGAVADLAATHGIVFNASESTFYAAGRLDGMAGTVGIVSFTVDGGNFSAFAPYSEDHRVVNGMAFGPDGSLYTSDPLATSPPYLNRVGPGGDGAGQTSTPWRDHYGVNGLWPSSDGTGLFAAVTGDQSSIIEFIPFNESRPIEILHESTLGAASLQPGLHAPAGEAYLAPKGYDDLTVDDSGLIYAAAHVTGEIIRLDSETGNACAMAAGLEEPTSLRFAPESFGEHAGDLFVTDMGGVGVTALFGPGQGAVWRIDIAP